MEKIYATVVEKSKQNICQNNEHKSQILYHITFLDFISTIYKFFPIEIDGNRKYFFNRKHEYRFVDNNR